MRPSTVLWRIRQWPAQNIDWYVGSLIVLSVIFWSFRIIYWNSHIEEPFSDLLGYVLMADNIVAHFFFGVNPTHATYYTPVTPLIIAASKLVSPGHYLWVFRYLVQLLTFCGAIWLVHELKLVTRSKWLALSFLLIVAICRPSIFWSLKPATETVCETLLYLSAATALATVRTRLPWLALVCGSLCLALGLNRPNFMLGVIFVPLAFLFEGLRQRNVSTNDMLSNQHGGSSCFRGRSLDRRALMLAVFFAFGFVAAWSPWVIRNLLNYDMFVPTSGSGLITMHWDYGGAPIRIGRYDALTLADGSKFSNFGITKLVPAADAMPEQQRAEWLRMLTTAWLSANLPDLPRLFLWRLKRYVTERGASGLTRVSREDLFPATTPQYNNSLSQTSWMSLLLLDKTPTVCILATVGVLIMAWAAPTLSPIFIGLVLMPWLAGAMVLGYERTVESLIGFTLWFALFGLTKTALRLQRFESDWTIRATHC